MIALADRLVLVTGANGFIGSHLTETLLTEGAHVRALCRYDENGSWGWLDELSVDGARLEVRLGDVRDPGFVEAAVAGVDTVFHLAALVSIPYSYEAPATFVDTNIGGTLNVLEAVRRHDTRCMVQTSTSEVYGSPEQVPIREDHPLNGQSPYSASKIGADKLCEAYARSFDVPVVTLRPFNTYGPRQSARAVIPTILGQLLSGVDPIRLGSLSPRRDFTYVADTVAGFLAMATHCVEPGSVIQLGTGRSLSVGELFELCCDVTGVHAELESDEARFRPEESEVNHLLSDPARAASQLDWAPTTSLEQGLEQTAAWLRDRVDAGSATRYHR